MIGTTTITSTLTVTSTSTLSDTSISRGMLIRKIYNRCGLQRTCMDNQCITTNRKCVVFLTFGR